MTEFTERLGAIELQDPEGVPVRLGEAWRDGPALVVFIRHFG